MKHFIETLLQLALKKGQTSGEFPVIPAYVQVRAVKGSRNGAYSSNIALVLAKALHKRPQYIAKRIIAWMSPTQQIQHITIADPGFINFYLSKHALQQNILRILEQKDQYGRSKIGRGKRILLEFLSATPVDVLNVEQGRHAVVGVAIANLLDAIGFKTFKEYYVNHTEEENPAILANIRTELQEFNIPFDNWFDEKNLIEIQNLILTKLQAANLVYHSQGQWLRSTLLGDQKDRLLVDVTGKPSPFFLDMAYHFSKFDRGYDLAINIFGAHYHGYMQSLQRALAVLQLNPERVLSLFIQHYSLQQIQNYPLKNLRQQQENEALRFYYLFFKITQPLDVTRLRQSISIKNPYYYIQYATMRIEKILIKAADSEDIGVQNIHLLTHPREINLLNLLMCYPDVVVQSALQYTPHVLAKYLYTLANAFHRYYHACLILSANKNLCQARIILIKVTQQIFKNGLELLGIPLLTGRSC